MRRSARPTATACVTELYPIRRTPIVTLVPVSPVSRNRPCGSVVTAWAPPSTLTRTRLSGIRVVASMTTPATTSFCASAGRTPSQPGPAASTIALRASTLRSLMDRLRTPGRWYAGAMGPT